MSPQVHLRIYHWPLIAALKNYAAGDAITLAHSVEEARANLMADFNAYVRDPDGRWGYLFHPDGVPVDEDAACEIEQIVETLRKDVEQEPNADVRSVLSEGVNDGRLV